MLALSSSRLGLIGLGHLSATNVYRTCDAFPKIVVKVYTGKYRPVQVTEAITLTVNSPVECKFTFSTIHETALTFTIYQARIINRLTKFLQMIPVIRTVRHDLYSL